MDNTILLNEFDTKASEVRIRQNSIATKLTAFLQSEKASGKKITAINASDLDVDKMHIQTVYSALRKNNIDVKRGVSFVCDNIDAHYVSRIVVKL